MRNKFEFYDRHGVEEYYLYDPDTDTLDGWRRDGGSLIDIPEMDGWVSPRLGICFDQSSGKLVLRDPEGKPFESRREVYDLRRDEKNRADREASRANKEELRANRAEEARRAAEAKAAEQQTRNEKMAALLKAAGLTLPE
jgi:hypothetical protein